MRNGTMVGMACHDDALDALRASCTRFLSGHGPHDAAGLLATIPADAELDRYGDGGVVAVLEAEVAGLLGKPAAVFLPSGTMAQQSVLRVHADRLGRRTVGFHPACHVDRHEGRGYERLHALIGRPIGDPNRLLTLDDLEAVAEPLAALLLELPQRDLGGQQPAWADLQAQVGWARARLSLAYGRCRLWESAAGYRKPPAEVAAPFDTVYVSFYKAVGALPGCCVAGPEEVIAEVREWRRRMGGTLFGLWPSAASARTCLARRGEHTGQESRSTGGRARTSVTAMTSIEFLTLEVADPTAADRFYTAAFGLGARVRLRASQAPTTGFRGFTLSLTAFDTPSSPVKLALYGRRALAKDAGVAPDGTGSHRLVIGGDAGSFTDPDGFAWDGRTAMSLAT